MAYPHLDAPSDGYVFLVTYGRSGSTLLQNVLNAIPGYCIRGENGNVLCHMAMAWHALATTPAATRLRKAGRATQPSNPWYGIEQADPDRMARRLANLFVREVLDLPAGTRVGGFKEIRFHDDPAFFPAYMAFLGRFFPKARLVFNTRAHDAVLKSGWWAKVPPARARAQLERAEALFTRAAADHPDRSLSLRYEDYAGKPDGLRPLFDFLGEPFDADRVTAVLDQRLTHAKRKGPAPQPERPRA